MDKILPILAWFQFIQKAIKVIGIKVGKRLQTNI